MESDCFDEKFRELSSLPWDEAMAAALNVLGSSRLEVGPALQLAERCVGAGQLC